jgi:hypothetical protein
MIVSIAAWSLTGNDGADFYRERKECGVGLYFQRQQNLREIAQSLYVEGFVVDKPAHFPVIELEVLLLDVTVLRHQLVYSPMFGSTRPEKSIFTFRDFFGLRGEKFDGRFFESFFSPVGINLYQIDHRPRKFIPSDVIRDDRQGLIPGKIEDGGSAVSRLVIPFPLENRTTFFFDEYGGFLNAGIVCKRERLYPGVEVISVRNLTNPSSGNKYPVLDDGDFVHGATSDGTKVRILYPGVYVLTVCSKHNRIPGDERNQGRGERSRTKQEDDHSCKEILIFNPEPAITQGRPLRRPKTASGDNTEPAAQ